MDNKLLSISNFKKIILFTKKILFFLTPFIFLFLFALAMLWLAGEFASLERVSQAWDDSQTEMLFGKAYFPDNFDLKEAVFEKINPEIVSLGNSRVLEFRREMFVTSTSFYNLAGVSDIQAFRKSLASIPRDAKLKVLLVGLDQSFVNIDGWNESTANIQSENDVVEKSWSTNLSQATKNVLVDFLKGKISFLRLWQTYLAGNRIGMMAAMTNAGTREDGSRYYADVIEDDDPTNNEDYNFKDTMWRIENNKNLFRWGQDVSLSAVDEFDSFLQEASERNIYVIVFLPPYAPTIYQKVNELEDKYLYISKIAPILQDKVMRYNFSFFDFTNIQGHFSEVTDQAFFDGFHGSEVVYLKMLISMAENDDVLRSMVDLDYLKALDLENDSLIEVQVWR